MNIDLRQLRHFIALIEHRSFAAASAAVHLSQSAFSRSIQSLENNIGYRLVDRGEKGLNPTRHGLLVLEDGRQIVQGARSLIREVEDCSGTSTGLVRFGSGPAAAGGLVAIAVGRFITEYPAVKTYLQVDSWQGLKQKLSAEDIDFFIADSDEFESSPNHKITHIKPRRWNFCCRAGHPLSCKEEVRAEDLLQYPLATVFHPPRIHKLLCELSGRRDFTPTVECEHGYALINIVQQSDAIGIACTNNFQQQEANPRLIILKLANLLPEHEDAFYTRYGIVSRVDIGLSPMARALINQLVTSDEEI